MVVAQQFVQDLTAIEFLLVIILAWVLVPLWQRFIDNLSFQTLGLDTDSTYQTFIIALVTTVIFFVFIFAFNDITAGIIQTEAPSLSPSGGGGEAPTGALSTTNGNEFIIDDGGNIQVNACRTNVDIIQLI